MKVEQSKNLDNIEKGATTSNTKNYFCSSVTQTRTSINDK